MKKFTILFVFASLTLACQRPQDEGTSKLTLHFSTGPSGFGKMESVSAMAAWPTGKKLCYGVNVTAPDLPKVSQTCGPILGKYAGFAPEGSSLSLDVERGTGRTVDLYVQVIETNQNCQTFIPSSASIDPSKVYKIGSALNVDTSKDVTEVSISAVYPGDSSHIAQTLGLPASCLSGSPATNPISMRTSFGYGQGIGSNSTTMKIRVRDAK